MFKIKLVVVGKIKEEYYRDKVNELLLDIRKKVHIEIIEIDDESIPKNSSDSIINLVKEKEGKKILENISNNAYVVALCIDGRITTNEDLSKLISEKKNEAVGEMIFVIGGSLGLWDMVVKRANYKLSFSKMTFPHQLMRVMLIEQISNCLNI